ncbi:MAG: hypothetical protein RLZZ519_248 [Bacteroidota bacterium]|jgi:predicted membrane protein
MGFIKFGSHMDLLIPLDAEVSVNLDGDCVGEVNLFEVAHSIVHFALKYSRTNPSSSLL